MRRPTRLWGKTLAELLKEAGYKTAAFHWNPHISAFFGYNRGFDTFNDNMSRHNLYSWRIALRAKLSQQRWVTKTLRKLDRILRPILFGYGTKKRVFTAEKITGQALPWLKQHQERFFLWVQYMDVHHPYIPPPKYLAQFHPRPISQKRMQSFVPKMLKQPDQLSSSDLATLIDLYDASIRYVDDNIGSLLKSLGSNLTNTMVIITSDHGDEFMEHGGFSHHTVYDELLRVPLIISGPGIKGNTLVRQQVSLLDLAPTIADLAGIDSVPSFQGKSLLPVIEGKKIAEGSISTFIRFDRAQRLIAYRTPRWKYIRTEGLDKTLFSEELYNLVSDPQEKHNQHGSEDEEARAFELEAAEKIRKCQQLYSSQARTAYEKQRIKAKLSKLRQL